MSIKHLASLFYLLLYSQILTAFEKNEVRMNGQVISNRCYASAVKLSSPFVAELNKIVKTLILTQKSNHSNFR